MMQTEFLHAGGVDEVTILIKVIESRVGSGMAASIEGNRNFGSGAFCSRDERIDESGFSHA